MLVCATETKTDADIDAYVAAMADILNQESGSAPDSMATIKYDNATYRTYGDLPAIGSRAPDVSLVNTKLQNATLANWMGIRKVMNIIVSVDTDVCAKSVIEFDRLQRV